MFLIISGCSGVGKNTIIKELLNRHSNYKIFKTCTTRGIRAGEDPETAYFYFTREEFEDKLARGEFFEHEEIHGNFYGTLNKTVEMMKNGGYVFIKDIGVDGQNSFANKLSDEMKVVSVFLSAPKDELIRRLTGRGEENIEKRMERYDYENAQKGRFDYVIDNVDMEETIKKIEEIVENANN